MFIRRAKTGSGKKGGYHTYRLVQSVRDGDRVRQRTLLNLGTHFDIEKPLWPLLCSRVLQLLRKENPLFALECPEALESKARYIYAQLVERDPKKNLSLIHISEPTRPY